MRKFRIMLEGNNILMQEDSQINKFGFFTTRLVEAESENVAKELAINLVVSELNLIILNSTTAPPSISIESIDEVTSFGNDLAPGKGFSWYRE